MSLFFGTLGLNLQFVGFELKEAPLLQVGLGAGLGEQFQQLARLLFGLLLTVLGAARCVRSGSLRRALVLNVSPIA